MSDSESAQGFTIHPGFLEVCDGDHYAAGILWVLDRIQVAIEDGRRESWFVKSAREIAEKDLLGWCSRGTVARRLEKLEEMGLIEKGVEPEQSKGTRLRVRSTKLNRMVNEAGYAIPWRPLSDAVSVSQGSVSPDRSGQGIDHSDQGGSKGIDHTEQSIDHSDQPAPSLDNVCVNAHARGDGPPDCNEFFDISRGRVDPHDEMDAMQFQTAWKRYIGRQYQFSSEVHRDRMRCLLAHFSEREIREALIETRKEADNPGWGYFRKVVQGNARNHDDDKRDSGGDGTTASDLVEKYR